MDGLAVTAAHDEHALGELVDIANIPLVELLRAHGDSPVLRSMQRLQQSLDDPNGVLSAFSSFIAEP